jgi:hypothetical protein
MRDVRSRVQAVKRRANALRRLRASAVFGLVVLSGWAASMLADLGLGLPWASRLVLLAGTLGLAWVISRRACRPTLDEDEAALLIEQRANLRHNPVVSAIQLERVSDSPMLRPVALAAWSVLGTLAPKRVVPLREASIAPVIAGLLLAGIVGAWIAWPSWLTPLAGRALLVPGLALPKATTLELLVSDPLVVRAGDPVRIEVRAAGVLPDSGRIVARLDAGATRSFTLERDSDAPASYTTLLEGMTESFTYEIALNDARSPGHRVRVVEPPEVVGLDATVGWPAYTARDTEQRTPIALRVIPGSTIALTIAASRPASPTQSELKLEGADLRVPLQADPHDPRVLRSVDPINAGPAGSTIRGTITLRDEEGIASRNSVPVVIEVEADAAPRIVLAEPVMRDRLVTPRARPRVSVSASDDFGLGQLVLRAFVRRASGYQLPGGDGVVMTAYARPDFTGRSVARRVERIDEQFGGDAPAEGLPIDLFSVAWEGLLLVPESGRYQFRAEVDDHVRVWLDGTVVFSTSIGQNLVSRPIEIAAGLRRLRVELREDYGEAYLRLSWRREGGRFEPIAVGSLFTSDASAEAARNRAALSRVLWSSPPEEARTELEQSLTIDLESLNVRPGDVVECWIEASDHNDVSGPGVARSEGLTLRIGTDEEVRSALLERLGDYEAEIERIERRQTRVRDYASPGGER